MCCRIRLFRKYLYQDMILKFINLQQAHTNTIYNSRKKLYCQIRNVWENFSVKIVLKSKNCKWVKISKKTKKLCFGNRSRPIK